MSKDLLYLMLACVLILYSCNYDPTYTNEIKGSEWEDCLAPLNIKEKALQDSMLDLGFIVEIERPYIGRNGKGGLVYLINLISDTISVTQKNYNSLISLRENIVSKLYLDVIDDSVIYDLKYVSFSYELKKNIGINHQIKVSKEFFFPFEDYDNEFLSKQFGLKVIKEKNGNYKRVEL